MRPVVCCMINTVSATGIPLENFARVDGEAFDKILVVTGQDVATARAFLEKTYPALAARVMSVHGASGPFGRWRRTLRLLREHRVRVLHCHHTASALLGALCAPLVGAVLLVTAHSVFARYSRVQQAAFAVAFLFADRVVCNSDATCTSLPWFVRRAKTLRIYNGVDVDAVVAHARPRPADARVVVGTVARFIREKDLPTLVTAFARARARAPALSLLLVGDGPERPRLEALVRELGVAADVAFAGALPRSEVYRRLGGIDVFVVSSRHEGFCNAMVEAAAAGRCVVATDRAPLPEVIGDGNARFFPVGDADALADALVELAHDSAQRNALGAAGQARASVAFPLHVSVAAHERLYRAVAG